VIDRKAQEQIRKDSESLRQSGMDRSHVRKVEENARRLVDSGMEKRERTEQRNR